MATTPDDRLSLAVSGARLGRGLRAGRMQVPYLADPNTGVETYEPDDIVAYLERTYART